ncbi:MAG: cytochrome b [Hyphomicrobiaceae bacterium]
MQRAHSASGRPASYPPLLRALHWITVVFVVALFVSGLVMTNRAQANIWDATTNALYSAHKLAGFVLLWLITVRLVVKLASRAPAPPAIAPWQRFASTAAHVVLYVLLIVVPMLGWLGVSLFPALTIFGAFDLPALAGPDRELSRQVFDVHKLLAMVLIAVVLLHAGGALMHLFVWRDGVFQRMWPSRRR